MKNLETWQFILYMLAGSVIAMWSFTDVLQDATVVRGVRQIPVQASFLLAGLFWIVTCLWPVVAVLILVGRLFGLRTAVSQRHYDRKPPHRGIW